MMGKKVDFWVTTDLERIVNGIMCCANKKALHHEMCKECDFRCAKWTGYDVKPLVETIRNVLNMWEQRKCD